MKTHDQAEITLGMKNLKGLMRDSGKKLFHRYGLVESIVDLNTVLKPCLEIVDGTFGQEGLGPVLGDTKEMDLIIGSKDVVACESVTGLIMCIGAALSGMAADKFGRRKVIMLTLLIYGIASGISAFSVNYTMLIVMRFFTGFGLGGELPAASTLVSELSPTKIRGRNVIILESFWAWGWIVASMVSYLVIPQFGWRAALLVGAVPALFAAVLRAAVPESPRYLEQIGEHEEADRIVSAMEAQAGEVVEDCVTLNDEVGEGGGKVRFAELWSRKYLSTTIVLWAIWFGINIGYYGFVLWTPTLLMAKGFTMDGLPVFVAMYSNASIEADIYQHIIDQAETRVIVVECADYRVLYANKTARDYAGYEEYAKKQCYEYLHGASESCPECFVPYVNDNGPLSLDKYDEAKKKWEHGQADGLSSDHRGQPDSFREKISAGLFSFQYQRPCFRSSRR